MVIRMFRETIRKTTAVLKANLSTLSFRNPKKTKCSGMVIRMFRETIRKTTAILKANLSILSFRNPKQT
jgi:hypothetical protein